MTTRSMFVVAFFLSVVPGRGVAQEIKEEPKRGWIDYVEEDVRGVKAAFERGETTIKYGMTMPSVTKVMRGTRLPQEGIGYITKFELSDGDNVGWSYEKDTQFLFWVYVMRSASTYCLYDSATVTGLVVYCALGVNFDRQKGTVVNIVSDVFDTKEFSLPSWDMHDFARRKAKAGKTSYSELLKWYRYVFQPSE